MGNTEYREHELQQYLPQMHNFTLTHCYSPLSIYRNIFNSEEIMEFKERLYTTQDIDRKVQTFVARYQHLYLVSSLYMKLEGGNNCGHTEYQFSVFYERVVTNLSKIKQISFIDSLHCLSVALKGFQILYKNFGYFEIFENMFHISQRGRLKVWCNQNIYKNVPEQYLLGDGKEEDMVIKVINIIDLNTDEACRVFPIKDILINLHKITFANAIVALRQICRQNNFTVSQNLESLENFSQFQSILDIYAPPKRFPKDTQITFHPKNSQIDQQRGSKATPMRSSSNSSHKTGNKILPFEHGKSMENSRNSKQGHKFQLTIAQEDQFPKFMAGRQKNYSKSNSSSRKLDSSPNFKSNLVQNTRVIHHPHLQQFSKIKPDESQLRKRTHIQAQQPISRYSYVPNQRIPINQPQQHPKTHQPSQQVYYYNRPGSSHMVSNPPANISSIQRPSTPQILQRQASAPSLVVSQPSPKFAQYSQVNTGYYQAATPVNYYAPTNSQIINKMPDQTQYHQLEQQPPYYRYPIHNTQQSYNQIQQNIQQTNQVRQNNLIPANFKPSITYQQQPQAQRATQVRQLEKSRGLSVPVKMTYQGIDSKELILSPQKKQTPKMPLYNQQPNKYMRNYPSKDRLVTLGEISGQKSPQNVVKSEKKDDKIQISQLQSKIDMLQSFADNKITTQQFLPNQSHALSNIKWEKNSNSGRDSVTSAFRKDILLELSNKPSEKKGFQEKREQSLFRKQSYKNVSKFDDNGYYTNQKLLQLIKANTNNKPYEHSKLTFEEKMKKYENKYGQHDIIKEQTIAKQTDHTNFYDDLYKKYNQKYTNTSNNIFGEEAATPTFGASDHAPFRKKQDPYINKISAISQKWEEENICSTSNGSRGRNIQSSNIDDDILEDMHNEGFGMHFKKGR